METGGSGGRFAIRFEAVTDEAKRRIKDLRDNMKMLASDATNFAKTMSNDAVAHSKQFWKGNQGRDDLGRFTKQAGGLRDVFKDLSKINLSKLNLSSKVFAIGEAVDLLSNFRVDIGGAVLGMMKEVSSIESAQLRLQRLGNMTLDQSREVITNVRKMVQYTPFMQDELIGITEALVQGKVALTDYSDKMGNAVTINSEFARGVSKADETTLKLAGNAKVNALSVMSDFAALTGNVGEKMPFFVRGIQRAFSTGSGILLMDQLNAEARKVLFGAGGAQLKGTAGEAINRVYKYLQEKGAVGMAAMASSTYEGLISNFKEIPKNLAIAIMGDPTDPSSSYSRIKGGLADLYTGMASAIDNPEFMAAVKGGLEPLLNLLISGLQKAGKALEYIGGVVKRNPWIVTLGAGLLVVTSAVATLTGGLLLLAGAISAVSLLGSIMAGIFSPVVIILGGLTLAIAGVSAIAAVFVAQSAPIQDFFSKAKVVVSALTEAIQNWGGETTDISGDTARELEKAGMLGMFLDIVAGVRKFEIAVKRIYDYAVPVFEHLGGVIGEQLREVARALGNAGVQMGVLETSADGSIGEVADMFVFLATKAIDFAAAIIVNVIPAVKVIDGVLTALSTPVGMLIDMFANLYDTIMLGVEGMLGFVRMGKGMAQLVSGDVVGAFNTVTETPKAMSEHLSNIGRRTVGLAKAPFEAKDDYDAYKDRWSNMTKWNYADQESRIKSRKNSIYEENGFYQNPEDEPIIPAKQGVPAWRSPMMFSPTVPFSDEAVGPPPNMTPIAPPPRKDTFSPDKAYTNMIDQLLGKGKEGSSAQTQPVPVKVSSSLTAKLMIDGKELFSRMEEFREEQDARGDAGGR